MEDIKMACNIKISNKTLECEISTLGAELKSVKKGGRELIWQGDPKFWTGSAPVLFPICGGLKDDVYFYGDKEYTLFKHGYVRGTEFEVEEVSDTKVVFLHQSNCETKKSYPFDYEFRVVFALEDNKLTVDYVTKNTGNGDMYYSVGAHEAYACPEGIEEYSVIFEKEEKFEASTLFGNLLGLDSTPVIPPSRELALKTEYFAVDALVFLGLKSRSAELIHRNSGRKIKLDFEGHDYFLIWQKPGANYICLEPWCGVPDFIDSKNSLTEKPGIIKLESGNTDIRRHVIKF
jgi:galactose mutarotase-like enzyme